MSGTDRVRKGDRRAEVLGIIEQVVREQKIVPSPSWVGEQLDADLHRSVIPKIFRDLVKAGYLSEPLGKGNGFRLEKNAADERVVLAWAVVPEA